MKCPNCKTEIIAAEPEFKLLEENAKLREQLASANVEISNRGDWLVEWNKWKQRAEAAEAKLKAASEQEPVMWYEAQESARNENVRNVIGSMLYSTRIHYAKPDTSNPIWPIYPAPIPPADVQDK